MDIDIFMLNFDGNELNCRNLTLSIELTYVYKSNAFILKLIRNYLYGATLIEYYLTIN